MMSQDKKLHFSDESRYVIMTIENRELLHELEESYPQFFSEDPPPTIIRDNRCSMKNLTQLVLATQYYYSQAFKYKLMRSQKSLTREEYENGLMNIEYSIWF